MKITYSQWSWDWRLRLLPSIEFSNFKAIGVDRHYGYKYEIVFRWLPYWLSIEIGEVK